MWNIPAGKDTQLAWLSSWVPVSHSTVSNTATLIGSQHGTAGLTADNTHHATGVPAPVQKKRDKLQRLPKTASTQAPSKIALKIQPKPDIYWLIISTSTNFVKTRRLVLLPNKPTWIPLPASGGVTPLEHLQAMPYHSPRCLCPARTETFQAAESSPPKWAFLSSQ